MPRKARRGGSAAAAATTGASVTGKTVDDDDSTHALSTASAATATRRSHRSITKKHPPTIITSKKPKSVWPKRKNATATTGTTTTTVDYDVDDDSSDNDEQPILESLALGSAQKRRVGRRRSFGSDSLDDRTIETKTTATSFSTSFHIANDDDDDDDAPILNLKLKKEAVTLLDKVSGSKTVAPTSEPVKTTEQAVSAKAAPKGAPKSTPKDAPKTSKPKMSPKDAPKMSKPKTSPKDATTQTLTLPPTQSRTKPVDPRDAIQSAPQTTVPAVKVPLAVQETKATTAPIHEITASAATQVTKDSASAATKEAPIKETVAAATKLTAEPKPATVPNAPPGPDVPVKRPRGRPPKPKTMSSTLAAAASKVVESIAATVMSAVTGSSTASHGLLATSARGRPRGAKAAVAVVPKVATAVAPVDKAPAVRDATTAVAPAVAKAPEAVVKASPKDNEKPVKKMHWKTAQKLAKAAAEAAQSAVPSEHSPPPQVDAPAQSRAAAAPAAGTAPKRSKIDTAPERPVDKHKTPMDAVSTAEMPDERGDHAMEDASDRSMALSGLVILAATKPSQPLDDSSIREEDAVAATSEARSTEATRDDMDAMHDSILGLLALSVEPAPNVEPGPPLATSVEPDPSLHVDGAKSESQVEAIGVDRAVDQSNLDKDVSKVVAVKDKADPPSLETMPEPTHETISPMEVELVTCAPADLPLDRNPTKDPPELESIDATSISNVPDKSKDEKRSSVHPIAAKSTEGAEVTEVPSQPKDVPPLNEQSKPNVLPRHDKAQPAESSESPTVEDAMDVDAPEAPPLSEKSKPDAAQPAESSQSPTVEDAMEVDASPEDVSIQTTVDGIEVEAQSGDTDASLKADVVETEPAHNDVAQSVFDPKEAKTSQPPQKDAMEVESHDDPHVPQESCQPVESSAWTVPANDAVDTSTEQPLDPVDSSSEKVTGDDAVDIRKSGESTETSTVEKKVVHDEIEASTQAKESVTKEAMVKDDDEVAGSPLTVKQVGENTTVPTEDFEGDLELPVKNVDWELTSKRVLNGPGLLEDSTTSVETSKKSEDVAQAAPLAPPTALAQTSEGDTTEVGEHAAAIRDNTLQSKAPQVESRKSEENANSSITERTHAGLALEAPLPTGDVVGTLLATIEEKEAPQGGEDDAKMTGKEVIDNPPEKGKATMDADEVTKAASSEPSGGAIQDGQQTKTPGINKPPDTTTEVVTLHPSTASPELKELRGQRTPLVEPPSKTARAKPSASGSVESLKTRDDQFSANKEREYPSELLKKVPAPKPSLTKGKASALQKGQLEVASIDGNSFTSPPPPPTKGREFDAKESAKEKEFDAKESAKEKEFDTEESSVKVSLTTKERQALPLTNPQDSPLPMLSPRIPAELRDSPVVTSSTEARPGDLESNIASALDRPVEAEQDISVEKPASKTILAPDKAETTTSQVDVSVGKSTMGIEIANVQQSNMDVEIADVAPPNKKRPLETWATSYKRYRTTAKPVASEEAESFQVSRVDLEKLKLLLYTAGSRVHRPLGYERLFSEYWNALSHRLKGSLSDAERLANQAVLNSFLKTKTLRKLHNKMILGLLERCVEPVTPLSDIPHGLPRRIEERIIVARSRPSGVKVANLNEVTSSLATTQNPADPLVRKVAEDTAYSPAILELDLKQSEQRQQRTSDGSALRIPGAVVIDPHLRSAADALGMTASEHAVWLMVVAVKEYSKSLIDSAIATAKAVESGHVPPAPRRYSTQLSVLPKKRSSETGSKNATDSQQKATKRVSSVDLHAVTSTLPTSGHALSGSVSRVAFERGLHQTYDRSFVTGDSAFNGLKSYIISAIAPNQSKRMKVEPPSQPALKKTADEAIKGRKSPSVRGLGRGAKDLAALKARASTTVPKPSDVAPPKPIEVAPPASVAPVNKPQTPRSAVRPKGKDLSQMGKAKKQTEKPPEKKVESAVTSVPNPNAGDVGATADSAKLSTEASESAESQQSLAQRRGKGHGVKSLAAMRARSATSTELLTAAQSAAEALGEGQLADDAGVGDGSERSSQKGPDKEKAKESKDAETSAPVEPKSTPAKETKNVNVASGKATAAPPVVSKAGSASNTTKGSVTSESRPAVVDPMAPKQGQVKTPTNQSSVPAKKIAGTPAANVALVGRQVPASGTAPVVRQAPASGTAPVARQAPASGTAPVGRQAPASGIAPVARQAITPATAPVIRQGPTANVAPVGIQSPAPVTAPVGIQAPAPATAPPSKAVGGAIPIQTTPTVSSTTNSASVATPVSNEAVSAAATDPSAATTAPPPKAAAASTVDKAPSGVEQPSLPPHNASPGN